MNTGIIKENKTLQYNHKHAATSYLMKSSDYILNYGTTVKTIRHSIFPDIAQLVQAVPLSSKMAKWPSLKSS
jgi:hypothetical protein